MYGTTTMTSSPAVRVSFSRTYAATDGPSVLFPLDQFLMRAARRLMTGAQQISLRMRAVIVSAGWLPRTEVVEKSPTKG